MLREVVFFCVGLVICQSFGIHIEYFGTMVDFSFSYLISFVINNTGFQDKPNEEIINQLAFDSNEYFLFLRILYSTAFFFIVCEWIVKQTGNESEELLISWDLLQITVYDASDLMGNRDYRISFEPRSNSVSVETKFLSVQDFYWSVYVGLMMNENQICHPL